MRRLTEFYSWGWPVRALVTFLLALCVLAQTLATLLSFYGRRRRLKTLPELCLLALVLFCSLLYGQVIHGYELSLLAPVGYGALRIGMGNRWFVWLYLAALLLLLARGVYVSLRRYREIRTGISAFSIKNAIDSLHTGVLFSRPDGFILLSNAQMQRLMTALTGRVQRSGRDFYRALASGSLRPGCRKAEFEGQIVCLLPDGTAWMFTRARLRIRGKEYTQLTAADITERWELTARLRRQNEQLERRSGELRRTIANLQILSRERETQRAKMRAHDILGQRLTLLLRAVRDEQAMDYALLRSLAQGLMDELRASGAPSPRDFLDSLRQEFGCVGVEIRLEGPLPEGCVQGALFADIVREGVSNAVRHGFATQVVIATEHTDAGCRMRITNNGPPPAGSFTEGGGLSGMREKVEACGGALRVQARSRFVLEIELPGGESHV